MEVGLRGLYLLPFGRARKHMCLAEYLRCEDEDGCLDISQQLFCYSKLLLLRSTRKTSVCL